MPRPRQNTQYAHLSDSEYKKTMNRIYVKRFADKKLLKKLELKIDLLKKTIDEDRA